MEIKLKVFFCVRDHIPLEQGLRLELPESVDIYEFIVRDHIPLEQGLRRWTRLASTPRNTVRDHIPLEQGLRLGGVIGIIFLTWLSETIFH